MRDFCSQTCKKEYRREYWAAKKREDRWGLKGVHKSGGYLSTDVHKTPPVEWPLSTVYKPAERGSVTLWKCPVNGLDHDWRAAGPEIYCARCEAVIAKASTEDLTENKQKKKIVNMVRAA
jgi:hypothetical protein